MDLFGAVGKFPVEVNLVGLKTIPKSLLCSFSDVVFAGLVAVTTSPLIEKLARDLLQPATVGCIEEEVIRCE